jgi:hypothetical protein
MIIKKLTDIPIMKTAHNVVARNLYNTENAVITVITLKPGQSLKKTYYTGGCSILCFTWGRCNRNWK